MCLVAAAHRLRHPPPCYRPTAMTLARPSWSCPSRRFAALDFHLPVVLNDESESPAACVVKRQGNMAGLLVVRV